MCEHRKNTHATYDDKSQSLLLTSPAKGGGTTVRTMEVNSYMLVES